MGNMFFFFSQIKKCTIEIITCSTYQVQGTRDNVHICACIQYFSVEGLPVVCPQFQSLAVALHLHVLHVPLMVAQV
jgi:hypothetical protein